MSNLENDLDIYYAVGNANTQRQENEIASNYQKMECFWMEIDLKKYGNLRHLKPVFKSLPILGKEIVINTVDIGSVFLVSYKHQKLLTH